MSRWHVPKSNGDGWTDWWKPLLKGYKLACCSCGLVHNIDFRIVGSGKRATIEMRTQLNNRSTAALRRSTDYECTPKRRRK